MTVYVDYLNSNMSSPSQTFMYAPVEGGFIPLISTSTKTVVCPTWLWQERRRVRKRNLLDWSKEYRVSNKLSRKVLIEKMKNNRIILVLNKNR